ncbi:insulinase family protein [Elioraea tepida]|uniref:insulinase family protein n=1 Tax=Elioraea tepida TaxID=2843330 RepID=UPI002E2E0633|nr:insulinase family protein [Elioraea tepida]
MPREALILLHAFATTRRAAWCSLPPGDRARGLPRPSCAPTSTDCGGPLPRRPPGALRGGEFRERGSLDQVHLVLGFPAVSYADPQYHAALLLSYASGRGMSSLLFQEVREKRGLVYAISSFLSPLSRWAEPSASMPETERPKPPIWSRSCSASSPPCSGR